MEKDTYQDMDSALLDRQRGIQAIRNLADIYLSREQLENKGNLLGHYKSKGFFKAYLDIYEKAVIGRAENIRSGKMEDISWGYARLDWAAVEKRALCLVMNDKTVYRLRHLKNAETIAYMVNNQKQMQWRKQDGENS